MSNTISLVIATAAIALAALAFLQITKLRQRIELSLGDTDSGSLEKLLGKHHAKMTTIDQRLNELNGKYAQLIVTSSVASQKISIVRFNPFGDTGGDQSFSLAVLDAHDSGYVLTSIHGRQGTRVYIKPIDFGKSKYSLSDEEQHALTQAIKRVPEIPED